MYNLKRFCSTNIILIFALILFSTIGTLIITKKPHIQAEQNPEMWVPTQEDIAYQDSMYTIIMQTQQQLDTVRQGINKILWKLERLEYSDGSWDSIRYKKGSAIDKRRNPDDFEFNMDMECGDTLEVSATMYYPVVGQCDDTPDITADQTKIPDIYDCSHLRWIAVSQDLLWFNGGPIRYGDTVFVYAGHKTGSYIVRDAMNKRFKFKIDFLESVGTDLYSFTDAKLLINS
jgi:hypothetical protein|tara:strand:+ start:208 stop:900 length:693 start_codon:yes stop_codon:yes gene_type:complete